MFLYQKPLNKVSKPENKESIKERVRRLRREATFAESLLWGKLRNRKCGGYKFRRQHPIYIGIQNDWKVYVIADFCCLKQKVIIEVDGGYHNEKDQRMYDRLKRKELAVLGYRVIRFTNEEIEYDLMKSLEEIKRVLKNL